MGLRAFAAVTPLVAAFLGIDARSMYQCTSFHRQMQTILPYVTIGKIPLGFVYRYPGTNAYTINHLVAYINLTCTTALSRQIKSWNFRNVMLSYFCTSVVISLGFFESLCPKCLVRRTKRWMSTFFRLRHPSTLQISQNANLK